MLAVSCRNIEKTYGTGTSSVHALQGVNLDVQTGELLLIMGPSGSGKTTLISIISGILTQDGGECLVFGENLNQMTNGEKTAYRGKHIGFVFQAFNLVPMLTSSENVAVPLLLNGVPKVEAEKKAAQFLIRLGLQDKINTSPQELSGGQQQRVAIARGCIHDPKLIVCDEPTAYLDHEKGQQVMEILKEMAHKEDRAIIVVTHDPRTMDYGDRIVHMEDGQIVENK